MVWVSKPNSELFIVYNIIPPNPPEGEGAEVGKLIIKIVSLTITGSSWLGAPFKTTL
jgi:hypothetical protein